MRFDKQNFRSSRAHLHYGHPELEMALRKAERHLAEVAKRELSEILACQPL